MMDLFKLYLNYLSIQYFYKSKATQEINLYTTFINEIFEYLTIFMSKLDIDIAVGEQLDKIGDLIGLTRLQLAIVGLTDTDYSFYLKSKISTNMSSAYMFDVFGKIGIQTVIQYLFNGHAYVKDNQDMSLTLVVDSTVDTQLVLNSLVLMIFPKAQGVAWEIIETPEFPFFGFFGQQGAVGFGVGGFANKIF